MERKPSREIATILKKLDPEKYANIIERASLNGYHDFKFECIPGRPEYADCLCPKVQLVCDLGEFPELSDLRQQVIDGDFDDPPENDDEHEMRNWLIDDNAGDAFFTALGFEVPTPEEREARKLSVANKDLN